MMHDRDERTLYARQQDRIAALEAELAERTRERDKARADVQWMFDKAAEREPTLDGYRELGAKCAALEAKRDAERERRKAAEAVLRELENDDGVGDLIDAHFARYKD